MAQRVGKDREGKLERQLDALQIRAGAVDRRAIFEFAIGIVAPDHRIVGRRVQGQPRRRQTAVRKIGSASCSERVCQYEELTVVAGSLKKNSRHTQLTTLKRC